MTRPPEDGADAGESIEAVLSGFQSLGDNCEFGLVQRYAGLEPLGLFRFASAPLNPLIEGLESDFARYGAPGDLEIVVGYADHLTCISRSCGFTHSTGELAGTADPAALLVRETRKVAYLKRLLLEDLASGDRILVRKGPVGESVEDVMRLARAVARHGPSVLLRVEAAGEAGGDTGHRGPDEATGRGRVHRVSERVLSGRVRRFSPYDGGMDIDLEPWIALCREAHWRVRDRPGAPPPLAPASLVLRKGAQAHATDRNDAGTTVRTQSLAALGGAPEAGAIHVLSLWVWIPAGFEGQRIFPVFDRQRLACREADLATREAWQRIWISIRAPADPSRLRVGLGATAPGGQTLWSSGWRLTRGPVPAAEAPPESPPRRSWTRWLPGRR